LKGSTEPPGGAFVPYHCLGRGKEGESRRLSRKTKGLWGDRCGTGKLCADGARPGSAAPCI